jgi:hypothetical protein
MRIAYLISAYSHPDLLARMIRALNTESAFFFVHIDGKVNIKPFLALIHPGHNIIFLSNRAQVFWKGYGQVQAILNLIDEATSFADRQKEPFKYYVLLSGTDYPLKSNAYIHDFFEKSDSTEYILYWKLSDFWQQWVYKIEQYHFLDLRLTNPRNSIPYLNLRAFYTRVHGLVHRLIPKRSYLEGLIPFGGPEFWMLTHDAVTYILSFMREHKRFESFYRLTESPVEMVFQTILLNSSFAEKVSNYSRYPHLMEKWKGVIRDSGPCERDWYENGRTITRDMEYFNYRYIDWNPAREYPAILDTRDFDALMETDCLFARKVCPKRSKTLLDSIDKVLQE